jgi:hypothetical protein
VGSAICRKLVPEKPDKIIVSSLLKSEALDAVAQMRHEYPDHDADFFVPSCGNIFVREEFKDLPREEILSNPERRRTLGAARCGGAGRAGGCRARVGGCPGG